MVEDSGPSEMCRRSGCPRPRTHLSVFCEEHHQQQLEQVGAGADLRPRDVWRLVVGPTWLNVARGGVAGAAAATLDLHTVIVVTAFAAIVSALIGWRLSRRLVWQPELGFPIAFEPSPLHTQISSSPERLE